MRISDLLSPADVLIDIRAANKRLLLQDLATKAASSLGLNLDQVAPYLLEREALGRPALAAALLFRTRAFQICSDPTACWRS